MVIDCQACGAQQRVEDSKLPASGVITCRSCGAQIRIGAKPRSTDDDATVVSGARPMRRDPTGLGGSLGPIPLSGSSDRSSGTGSPAQGMDLGAIGVSNRRETKQFDVKTSPGNLQAQSADEEPIPLLADDDILDFDEADDDQNATIPGVSLQDLTRGRATPSFLDDVPTLIPGPSANEAPTRFNRNISDFDDLPASAPKMDAPKPAAPRPAPRPPSAAPRPPSTGTMPTQTIKPAVAPPVSTPAPAPIAAAPVATDWSATTNFAAPKDEPIPVPSTSELSFDSSFAAPLEIPMPAPSYSSEPLPAPTTDFSSPPPDFASFDNLPQWAPVDATVTKPAEEAPALDLELPSDLPAPSLGYDTELTGDLPVSVDAPATTSYSSTPYTSTEYGSTNLETDDLLGGDATMQMNRADLGIDFGSELPTPAASEPLPDLAPPSFEMDALPNDLPSIGDSTQLTGEPRLELEGDLPSPATGGGVMLSDDLPVPSIGLATDGDLPQPHGFGGDDDAPSLMDTAEQPRNESTHVMRDERTAGADAAPPVVAATSARSTVDTADEIDAPKPKKKKSNGALVALFVLVIIASGLALATKFADKLPFDLPWVEKPAPIAETPPPVVPTPTPDAPPAVPTETKTADAKPTEVVEAPPEVPALTTANVNELDYATLRAATKTLASDAGAANGPNHELVQWARYRLARWGDTEARDALLADAPQLSPQASELTVAAAVGVQMLQNKPMVARKNAERFAGPGPNAKAKYKDSVPVLLALAAASEKPPFKAIQVNDRVLAINPKVIDARVGKVEAQLAMPKPELRKQALADAVALVRDTKNPAVAVRLGGLLLNADAAQTMADITAPLTSLKQADDLPPGQLVTFAKLLAHRAAIAGDFNTAKEAIAIALQASPDDVALVRTSARIAAATGTDFGEILSAARTRATDDETKAVFVDEQVKLALSRGDVAVAKAAQALSRELAPRQALPFVKLSEARIASAEGKIEPARVAAQQALKARPKTFEARLFVLSATKLPPAGELAQLTMLDKQAASSDVDVRLAQVMNERSNPGGASELYARALWREPIAVDPIGVVLALADAQHRSGNVEKAQAYVESLRVNVGADERVGKAVARTGGAAALEYFEQAAQKTPDDLAVQLQYAQALIEAGKPIEAQTKLDALAKKPEGAVSAEVMRLLGRAWMTRDSVKARSYANDAIHASADAPNFTLLGEIEKSQQRFDEAIDAYRKAVKADSTNNVVRTRLARVQIQRGQWQDAAVQLRDIVQHDPMNISALELLGDALRDLGKPREAIVWYKKALELSPESATLMMKFARLQLNELGMVQPAMKSLRRVVQLHPELADAHYFLGYALKDMGKTAEAKTELEEYLRLAPGGEYAEDVKKDLQDLAR